MTHTGYLIGSAILSALDLIGLAMVARHQKRGWLVLLVMNAVGLPYQFFSWQWPFMIPGVLGIGIAVMAFASWGHEPGARRNGSHPKRRSLRRRRDALMASLAASPERPQQAWTTERAGQFEAALRREPLLAAPTVDGAR